jgi:hypothetical protein
MTASRTPRPRSAFVSPVIDYEPPPVGAAPCRSKPALRRRPPRPLRAPIQAVSCESSPPREAVVFADAALRRVLEVIDRRRPVTQLRPVLAPALIDSVTALTRSPHATGARLRRVRVRMVDSETSEAEVFGTYTRGPRVHAIAARIVRCGDRWRLDALQVG